MSMLSDSRKIGIGLCGIGISCLVLGACLLCERTLLALGNVAFLFGLGLLLGPSKTFRFFFRKEKWQGSTAYFLGIGLIIYGWSVVGFVLELYGVWRLFAAFLPNVLNSLKMAVPGFSTAMNTWPLSTICSYVYDQRRLPV
mmetsp:Transcript_102790/g.204093  ORF Transcript_102790/g.204093 Transcript_102790/m.204093 type:complete len:141 (+) Transcript_102790:78-500(+)